MEEGGSCLPLCLWLSEMLLADLSYALLAIVAELILSLVVVALVMVCSSLLTPRVAVGPEPDCCHFS